MARLMFLCITLLLSSALAAQQTRADDVSTEPVVDISGFSLLEDLPTKNQIPLFDNRFRIDENVDEITLLLFRRKGSASVVLVQPDGSKLHFNTADQKQVRWHDADSYDLIQIKQPMAGPWQAVGRLLPQSRIMVLTDIKLHVDALPDNIMVGETVKVTARLTNGDQPINAREFRDVLALEVIFISTNNADFDNFGRGIVPVAQFRDDGKGYDERARDGVFTGEFQLRFVAGEWIPKYIVRTPLYTREIEQAPVILKPAPIKAEITASEAPTDAELAQQPAVEAKPHQILFTVTDDAVNADSVLLQGRIRYPNGEVADFAMNEAGSAPRLLTLHNRGHGSYILEVSAFGTMKDGREFMLALPEISFVVNQPVQSAPVLEELPQSIKDEIAAEQAASAPQEGFPWGLVIFCNILILGGGTLAIWMVMTDKKLKDLLFWRKKTDKTERSDDTVSNNTSNTAPTSQKKTESNAQKNNDMDDILDLTLPDD